MWLMPPYCNLQYYDTSFIARHHCPAEQQVCRPRFPSCSIRPHTCRRMPYCQDMPWDNQHKLYYCIRPCTCPCTPCCLDSRHSSSYYIPTYIYLCIPYWRGTPWCRLRQPSYYILLIEYKEKESFSDYMDGERIRTSLKYYLMQYDSIDEIIKSQQYRVSPNNTDSSRYY